MRSLALLALCLLTTLSAFADRQWLFSYRDGTSGAFTPAPITGQNNKVFALDGSGNLTMQAGGGSASLGGLEDVALNSVATGQLLRWNGTAWANWTADYLTSSDLSPYLASATAASTYQPLDADLTAIAALTTTSHGRSLLDDADAAASRSTLGLVIGTNVQAWDSDLASIAALTTTSHGRGLLDDADATASRVSLGLVIGTNVQAWDSDLDDLADGTLSGAKVGTGINAANITSGTLAIANGGTGQSTASAARLALLPSITGQAGKYLRVNAGGTDVEYATVSGGGGSSISTPQIAYVSLVGNDGTGTLGDPSKPYASGTAAWNAGQATSQDFVIQFGAGSYSISTSGQSTGFLMGILGSGELITTVEVETGNASGASGNVTLVLHHLHCIITTSGLPAPEGSSMDGYGPGSVTLEGCATIAINARGGNGDGFQNGAVGGSVYLTGPLRLKPGSAIDCQGGYAGIFAGGGQASSGTLTADGCDIRGTVFVSGANLGRTSYTSGIYLITDSGGNAVY